MTARTPPPIRRVRRGIGSFIAVLSMGLLATGALALTALFRADAHRTQNLQAEAQLTELLRAGADAAQRMLTEAGPGIAQRESTPHAIDLPDAFDETAALWLTWASADETRADGDAEARALVRCEISRRAAEQSLTWVWLNGAWALQDAHVIRLR